ncbi:MAG: protein kinase [Planctomycetota bacterium]
MNQFTADKHPDDVLLRRFLADELTDQDSGSVASHIEVCVRCEKTLDHLSMGLPLQAGSLIDCTSAQELAEGDVSTCGEAGSTGGDSDDIESRRPVRFRHGEKYLVTGEIARGGMGVVYRGFDKELKREIAIKVALGTGGKFSGAEARFYREAQICGRLEHPGVVPVHELGTLEDGRMFIAMKLVEGETLETIIGDGSNLHVSDESGERQFVDGSSNSATSRLIDIFSQVCHTMAYAHSRDVVHRDLKPRNIMVGAFGEVQIMDWGLAKRNSVDDGDHDLSSVEGRVVLPGMTRLGSVMGTPGYMSPEQARGEAVDLRADVFALGGILCRILTGRPPFDEESADKSLVKASGGRTQDAIRQLNDCNEDPELVAIAVRCMAIEPADRPDDARDVDRLITNYLLRRDEKLRAAQLERARQDERIEAGTKRRRQRLWFAMAIAFVLLGTAFSTILYLAEKNARQADQFAAENRDIRDLLRRESEIQRLLGAVSLTESRALSADVDDRVAIWNEARMLVDAAASHLCDNVSAELNAQLDDTRMLVDEKASEALQRSREFSRNCEIIAAIEKAADLASYPDAMLKISANQEVIEILEKAFAGYELERGGDVERAAAVFQQSAIKAELVRGLQLWQVQLEMTSEPDAGWFQRLFDAVDPDPFRTAIRQAAIEQDREALTGLLSRPEAFESEVNAYAMLPCLRSLGMYTALRSYLKEVCRRFPDDFTINWSLAALTAFPNKSPEKGDVVEADYETARQHLLICHALQPDNVGVMVNLGRACDRLGQPDEALKYFERMVEQGEAVAQAYISMAAVLDRQGDYQRALELCELGLEENPEVQVGHINNSILLRRLKRFDEALGAAKNAVELFPDDAEALRHLAICSAECGKFDDAQEAIETALRINGPSDHFLVVGSSILGMQDRWDEFFDFNRKWSEFSPGNTDPKSRMCDALVELDHCDLSLALAMRFLEDHPGDMRLIYCHCRALDRTGNSERALLQLEKLLEAHPDFQSAKRLRRKIERRLARLAVVPVVAELDPADGCEEEFLYSPERIASEPSPVR